MTDPPPRPHGDQLVVCGATGYTGRLVVEALLARGTVPMITGRDAERVRKLADELGVPRDRAIVADVTHPPDVARVLDMARVLVSTAGPFTRVGETLVAGCASRGVHYVDSTGEAPFVRMVARRYDPTAMARGCTLVCACAYEVAVSDAAASLAAENLGEDLTIEIAYAGAKTGISQGTRDSAAEVLVRPAIYFDHDRLVEEPVGATTRRFEFAEPFRPRDCVSFGSPECITVPKHLRATRVRTYMSMGRPIVARVAGAVLSRIGPTAAPVLRAILPIRATNPSPEKRAESRFQVVAEVRSPKRSKGQRVVVTGRDMYGVSGAILAEAALALMRGDPAPSGLAAPSQVIDPRKMFDGLKSFDVAWTRTDI